MNSYPPAPELKRDTKETHARLDELAGFGGVGLLHRIGTQDACGNCPEFVPTKAVFPCISVPSPACVSLGIPYLLPSVARFT